MEREPRAALILNRFTRNLTVMYTTDAVTKVLGIRPDDLLERPFYECIQTNSVDEAERCLESAKANDSIVYLRFWYKDPRIHPNVPASEEKPEKTDKMREDDDGEDRSCCPVASEADVKKPQIGDNCTDVDEALASGDYHVGGWDEGETFAGSARASISHRGRPQRPQTFELEAVVSCTSDGLVVVLRRARPPIPGLQHPLIPAALDYRNGLFAAPWGHQPTEPYISPDLLYTFRPPLLPQYMPLRECIKAAGGPHFDRM
jgi:hypothetical protein